ncbi:MAG: C69 family dipeptidase [Candidatus Eremiobacteraeota bacterium]|nr:C69 family dipeptidase [Candidatus Eremiobacteraeota bacterium]
MKKLALFLAAAFIAVMLQISQARACTSFLVTRGASADGSTMITYTADSHTLYGDLRYYPAAEYGESQKLDIYEWDTGKFTGTIPQAARTYAVIGYMNEYQVAISETTFTGRTELKDPKGVIDYGNLITLALQRSKSAREAIQTMGALVERYGYCSTGETFSISDKNEVWMMDLIGKGPGGKGAVWVALKIPDGCVSAHANQSRIGKFPQNDSANCLYAKDVISFARKKGFFKGNDEAFSFADAYHPTSFSGLRACEARVWQFFRRTAPSVNIPIERVKGLGGKKPEPLPLWVKPDKKLSAREVMECMRDHFEGTEFDLSKGVGAGPYHLPYRWRPLTWKVNKQEYFNERSTSTQQTAFSFVSQSRSSLPDCIGGLLWFGVDDTASTVYVPLYAGIREVPKPFARGTGSFTEFSWDSAFWVFNFVSNFAYSRYCDMIKDIGKAQSELEAVYLARQAPVEEAALALYKQSPELASGYLTDYSAKMADLCLSRWKKLLTELLIKYLDGNMKDERGKVTHPGYPKDWYERIIKDSGDYYRNLKIEGEIPEEEEHPQEPVKQVKPVEPVKPVKPAKPMRR